MPNAFDQFDSGGSAVAQPAESNPFDQFDKAPGAANPFDAFDAPSATPKEAAPATTTPAARQEKPWEEMSFMERTRAMRDDPPEDRADSEHSINRLFEEQGKLPGRIIGSVAGPVMAGAGKVTLAGFSDLEQIMLGDPNDNAQFPNLKAYAENPQAPLPVQQDIREMKGTWAGTGAAVAAGAIEMVPKIGATAGLGMLGVPAPVANMAAFGFNESGEVDPVGAAAALGLPFVDKAGRALTASLITRRLNDTKVLLSDLSATESKLAEEVVRQHPLLTREAVVKALEVGGGQLANNLYLLALQTPGILDSENPKQALTEAMALNLGMSLLGAPEIVGGKTKTAENIRAQGGIRVNVDGAAEPASAARDITPKPLPPEVRLAEENHLPATAEVLKEAASAGAPVTKEVIPVEKAQGKEGLLTSTGAPATAAPVPEQPNSIAKQLEVTLDPASTKAVTLITPGSPLPPLREGLERVPVGEHGTADFNPAKTTREAVLAAAEGKDFDGTLLGMSQSAKPEPVGNTVVQTTKDGVPVLDEVVPPTPEAIAAASAAHASAVPGGETVVKPAEEVLAARKAGIDVPKPDLSVTDEPVQESEFTKYDAERHTVMHAGTDLKSGEPLYWIVRKAASLKSANPAVHSPEVSREAAKDVEAIGRELNEMVNRVGSRGPELFRHALDRGLEPEEALSVVQRFSPNFGRPEAAKVLGKPLPEVTKTKTPGTQRESGRVVSRSAEASPSPRANTSSWKEIGVNARGNPIFEDERGVRSYTENGIRVTEAVGVSPRGEISISEKRGSDFTPVPPVDKTASAEQPASSASTVGQPGESASGVDVREPAGTGADTQPEQPTAPAPRPTEPASPEASRGTEDEPGNERGRGVRSGDSRTAGTGGESGPVERPSAGAGAVAGTGTDLPQAGVLADGHQGRREEPTEAERNHVLPTDQDWIPSGDKAKVRANLDAIKLIKKLEAENRNPTPEEKTVLAKYTGWGGLKEVFDEGKAAYRERPPWQEDQKKEFANWEKQWGKLYDEVGEALSPEEHRAAAGSILNAHYTSREVINGVWKAVERLGFQGGKALEPAAGVGNFIGLTPERLRAATQWTGVELDDVSGRILAKLYPEARTYQMGFQDAKIAPNSQDLVISNVPFAADGPRDKRYPPMSLHNYFIARAIDLVKPGGIVAAITSDSTMDNSGAGRKAREFFAEKADLVGAIRLPNNAFKKNAGTEVTTDVLFFRKHDATPSVGQDFKSVVEAESYKGEPIQINEYFAAHPEMMLGRMSLEGTMYRADQQALIPTPGADLNKQISEAVAKLPENILSRGAAASAPEAKVELAEKGTKIGALTLKDGKPFVAEPDGSLSEPVWAVNSAKVAQAKKYITVRDTTRSAIDLMLDPNATEGVIAGARKVLNAEYDAYVKKYGAINERASSFLDDDVDFPLALALEDANTKLVQVGGKDKRVTTWTKSKLFTERTIFPRIPPEHVDTVPDAMQVSQNFQGKVDPEYIARLTGKPVEAVKSELEESGQAFENPATGQWENRATFLSGFVKDKLRAARNAAESDPRFERQVQELEKIQPPPIAIENIGARLGSTWVPPEVIEKFMRDTLQVQARVHFTPETGNWHVNPMSGQLGERNKTQYGIHDWKGHELVESALNLKSPVVTDLVPAEGGGTKEQKNPAKSLEAAEKQSQLQREFKKFILSDPETARTLEQIYNDKFNGVVSPKFEAPTWAHYPGASSEIALREHQKAVVTRMIQNSTLLAHAVGTGKTYAMTTAAMEMRRLGLAKKPMIVVQNATLEQFARAFKRLYPTARILAPNAKMRDAKNRNKTMARIATGDWDAVIIPQSFVNMLPDDPEREAGYISDRLDELEAARIEAAHEGGKRSPKASDLQKAIKRLQERLEGLADRKKDNVLTFEQLGVDALFVDEAHAYKKLEFTTQMDNIKGLDTSASQRGWSMSMKTRWVQEKNQGRNVIFATGTPVSNTIAEAWNMMRYVRPDVLKHYGIEHFDAFASTFGDTITQLEMTAGGTWKPVTRFARFSNGPELIAAWRTVADVVTPEEINLPGLPALKNGKPTVHTIKQSPELANYVKFLRSELERFAAMSGKEKRENSHIPLVVFGLAKKASLDMRMIDPTLPDQPGSKLNVAADEAARIYQESTAAKGTQMIFSDAFQDNPDAPRFNLYDEMKRKLIERGVPENQIAIITAEVKDAKRDALFQKVIEGEVRVLLGSTDRMGVGVNVQEKLIALHHLDAPPRPMDIEQRNGRIVRQGNTNPVVEVHSYGVENTLDAAMFQKLATKQKFINQILRGDLQGRNFEDAANEVSLSFEEQMAAFSGDKRAMEKVALENQVRQLEMLRSGHIEQVRKSRETLEQLNKRTIPFQEKQVADTTARAATFGEAFAPEKDYTVQIGKRTVTGRKEVAQALDHVFKEGIEVTLKNAKKSSHFGNFEIALSPVELNGKKILLTGAGQADAKGLLNPDRVSVAWKFDDGGAGGNSTTGVGFFHSLAATLERIASEPKQAERSLANEQRNLRELEGFVKQPFEREAELQQAKERAAALEAELKAEGEAKPGPETKLTEQSTNETPEEPPTDSGIISMGGQAPGDAGETAKAQLAQLTDAVSSLGDSGKPDVGKAFDLGASVAKAKESIAGALDGLRAAGMVMKRVLEGKPVVTDWKRMLGDRHLALSESAINARKWMKAVVKNIPNVQTREAISNWVDAGGDEELLRVAAAETKERYRAGYERALKLTPEEKTVAENLRNYFESRLQEAIDAGILEDGIENYIHRIYEQDSPWKKGVIAELRSGIFTGKPGLAKKRVFEYDYEAEKAGKRPIKDFAKRVVAYDLALNKAIADRAAVKAMMEIKMPDGRPMIDVGGGGKVIQGEAGTKEATLINRSAKRISEDETENRGDFKSYDHPALRKWRWVTNDADGKPIFVQGDVLVHPEAMKDVKVLFDRSAVRQNPVGNLALNASGVIKQTMLDLSLFHQVQIGIHGMEHRTFKPVSEIDFTNPDVRGLIRGGAVVGETSGRELFSEGLSGSSLTKHIPWVGARVQAYQEYLFGDFIPRLKVAMGLHALERNRERFPNLTAEQHYQMTASQMNAAFGALNWEMMGVSKTTQDVMRLTLLAPDFLIARAQFVGQGATLYGGAPHVRNGKFTMGEQGSALLLGAVTMYILARILNKLLNDEYHFEGKNAFNVIYKGRAYGVRTVQGDLIHLVTEPAKFSNHRLNPVYAKPALEFITSRDYFGRQRNVVEKVKDFALTPVPISLRGMVSGQEQTLADSLLNSIGAVVKRDSPSSDMAKLAQEWKEKNKIKGLPGEFVYDPEKDPYRNIKLAAERGDEGTARSEIEKAIQGGLKRQDIHQHFLLAEQHLFAGSRRNENAFVASLTEDQKKIYADAKAERKRIQEVVTRALR